MGIYLVHHPLHNFSPEVGGGRLHGNGRLQGTLQYFVFCMDTDFTVELCYYVVTILVQTS